MTLSVTGSEVTGEYHSKVSGAGEETTGHVRGWVDGDVISFVVNWDKFVAMTAWTGQLIDRPTEVLKTLWLLTKDVEDDKKAGEGQKLWGSTLIGADDFIRKA